MHAAHTSASSLFNSAVRFTFSVTCFEALDISLADFFSRATTSLSYKSWGRADAEKQLWRS